MATTTQAAPVDTSQVAGRRDVHYNAVDDILADAERLAAGGYTRLGNWPLGKMAKHITNAFNMALDGPPTKVPLPIRVIARWLYKDKAIQKMRPGFKLNATMAKHFVPGDTSDAEGIESLRTACRRWKSEKQRHPHPFFGKLTDDEWNRLMLRHAEMHMSFLVPK
ncbi:MAG: DUF1569 domain-containing protein [Planctomycetia bacterium]|nr:DUF1569 domain-containing protein [Planctomycetia bacterium]